MKKHQGRVTARSMLEFVLFEPAFPRSIQYTLKAAADQLGRIWSEPAHTSRARLSSLLAWLESQREDFDIGQTHPILTYVVDETAAICSKISEEIQGPPRATRVSDPGHAPAPSQGQSQSQTQSP